MKDMEKPAEYSAGSYSAGLENEFMITRFGIIFSGNGHTGQFCDHQFTGGVDDATFAEMAADGGKILSGEGNVQMAAGFTDSSVQADDLTMVRYFTDCDTAGIPYTAFRNTAHSTENNTCGNLPFLADGFYG